MKIPSDNPDADNADFREMSKYLSWGAYAAFALMVLGLVTEIGEAMGDATLIGGFFEQARIVLSTWLLALLMHSPLIIMAGVALDVGRLFRRYAKGEAFTARAAKTIQNIGAGLGLVVLFKGFVVPTLETWIAGENRILMEFADYDLGVAFAAAAIIAIGYVMRQAVAIKAESDQII